MLITIGLFFGIQTQFAHFQFGCYIKNRKNRNSCFGLFSFSRVASLLFGPGKGMAESFILYIKQLPKKFYGVCVVNKIIITNGRHLGLECYSFYNSRIATYTQEKNSNLHIIFIYFFIFPKGQHSYTQDSFRHGTVCGGRLAPFALSSSCL